MVRVLGRSLRYIVRAEPESADEPRGDAAIYCFWHRAVLPIVWYCRDRDIRVLTSRSRDGEIIAGVIEKFGYKAVRGSSSRAALTGLRSLQRELEDGKLVAFTIDGPRGPRYVAKPGPVLLAKLTGARIVCFYAAPERAWTLNSWDGFLIPKPGSRVHIRVSAPLYVSGNASEQEMEAAHREMQRRLDEVRALAEADAGIQ
ncbi:MAG: lysophospholipid acyltransferase family protein [Acidobacteriales bacterium]|nr:lysophospholipid acyltransferase family protein [Terriglobales bacterium]